MARRQTNQKPRTAAPAKKAAPENASHRNPKSMVIRIGAGEVGSSVSQLVLDVRRVMEPQTAIRLKERRANRLKDYVVMAGPLGVTHLLLFTRSPSGNTNLRIALTPRGPTLHFHVDKYSLAKDVQKAQRHPRGIGKEHTTPPLLVMNNFSTAKADANSKIPRHLESLVTTVFQSLFPPINPQATPLKSIGRVLLLNREAAQEGEEDDFVLNFRHYAITTRATGLSRPLRRLNAAEKLLANKTSRKARVPNLGSLSDIADYMIGGENGDGYMTDATSASELDTDAEVEVLDTAPRKVPRRKTAEPQDEDDEEGNVEKRAVKLVELGPRMHLRLLKVEEGLCAGKVLWHDYITKSKQEAKALDSKWEQRRRDKEARRKQQLETVEKKRRAKASEAASGSKGGKEGEGKEGDEEFDEDEEMDDYEFDSEGLGADGEYLLNEEMEEAGEWEDEEEEIANDN